MPAAAAVASYEGSDLAWSPYGPTSRMLRKVCVRDLLSDSALNSYYELRRWEVLAMVARVAERARNGAAVDIGRETFVTMMNIMTSMLWGGGSGDGDGTKVLGEEFKEVVRGFLELMGQPNLSDFFPCLSRFDIQGLEKKMWAFKEKLDKIFEQIIAGKQKRRHNRDGGAEADFLDVLLRIEREGADGKTRLTRAHTKGLLMNMVLGGTDTTSNTVEFLLADMMNRPDIVHAIQAELDECVGQHSMVHESQALKLCHLSAAIKESLRLHPIGPFLVPRRPSEDTVVGGCTIPAGSCIFVNVWAIHRDPELWEDPLAYMPERFLDSPVAACSRQSDFSGNNFAYIPFGSGRRMCAGTAMAERTLAYTLATLLQAFDWRLPAGESEVDVEEKFGLVLMKKKPLLLVPNPRLSNPDLYQQDM